MKSILIADNRSELLATLEPILKHWGYRVLSTCKADQVMAFLKESNPCLLIISESLFSEAQPSLEAKTKEKIKELEGVKDGCNNRIQEAIGENAIGSVPANNFKYTRASVKRTEYTVEASSYWVTRATKYDPNK